MPRLVNLANFQQLAAINVTSDPGAIGGPLVIPSAAQITLIWQLSGGKFGHNTLVGRYSGLFAGTAAQANSILTALTTGTQWTAMAAFLFSGSSLAGVTIRDLNSVGAPLIPNSTAGGAGASVGTDLPNESAICVTLRTAFTGPQNRGRMYIPGFASNAVATGNVVAAGAVTAVQNWAGTIAGILSAQGYVWCVGHPARNAYTGATGTSHPARIAGTVPITTVSVRDNHWDSQRRRGLK